jgi:hypothetical protein
VIRHIFQACPVWIYTQSNITSTIFTWVHYTNTEKSSLRAGSLGEREPARILIIYTCMRPIFGRRALIGW